MKKYIDGSSTLMVLCRLYFCSTKHTMSTLAWVRFKRRGRRHYADEHKRGTNHRVLLCGDFSKCLKVITELLFAMNHQRRSYEEEWKPTLTHFSTTNLITHLKSHHLRTSVVQGICEDQARERNSREKKLSAPPSQLLTEAKSMIMTTPGQNASLWNSWNLHIFCRKLHQFSYFVMRMCLHQSHHRDVKSVIISCWFNVVRIKYCISSTGGLYYYWHQQSEKKNVSKYQHCASWTHTFWWKVLCLPAPSTLLWCAALFQERLCTAYIWGPVRCGRPQPL